MSLYSEYPPEYDYPDVVLVANEVRRARVPRSCHVCNRLILPGQMYTHQFAIVDEESQVWEFHGHTEGECLTPEDMGYDRSDDPDH